MHRLYYPLAARIQELEQIIKQAETDIANAPEGFLRISKRNNVCRYYLRTDPKDTEGKYIRKSEMNLVYQIAQKDYAARILVRAHKEQRNLKLLLKEYQSDKIEEVYEKLSKSRQILTRPYILPEEKFIRQWEEQEYPINYQPDEDKAIYTEKNEAVRSKSEKILADKFKMMDIPYHYEKPLYLQGYGTIYPDFTVLNKRTRKEYLWEHFGLMDNPEYCEKAIRKIESMAKNDIFQGKNLIVTCETANHPLNMRMAEMLIKEYLL